MAQQKANALKNVSTRVADLEIPTVVHFLLMDLGVKRMLFLFFKYIYYYSALAETFVGALSLS